MRRLSRGCPRAETVGRIGAQQPRGHQPGAVDRDQPRPPGAARPAGQRAPHPDGARDRHRAGYQEGGDLDPAQRAVAEQARVVVGEPEAVPGQPLDQDRGLEHGPGQDAVAEQRPGDALGGGADPAGCGDGGLGGHDGSSLRFGGRPSSRSALCLRLERRDEDSTRSWKIFQRRIRMPVTRALTVRPARSGRCAHVRPHPHPAPSAPQPDAPACIGCR